MASVTEDIASVTEGVVSAAEGVASVTEGRLKVVQLCTKHRLYLHHQMKEATSL